MAKAGSKPRNLKKYRVTISLNGETFTCKTNDLKESLMAFTPKVFKTKLVVKVETKFDVLERVLMIHRAKALFRSEMVMDTFVKHLNLGLKNA